MSDSKKPSEPMDTTVRESTVGVPHANNPRVCYALYQLVYEVLDLFPEITYEKSDYDGRNTALGVTFEASQLPEPDASEFEELMGLLIHDARVREVSVDHEAGTVFVLFKSNPRTQDSRETFGLSEAWDVLVSENEEATSW